MAFSLAGKRALITGGSSGIGAALAVGFAREGATVGITARREDRLGAVLDQCREHAPGSVMWPADLSDPGEVDRVATSALRDLGGVDVLVNCAGIPKRRHVTLIDAATIDHVMQINFLSPARLMTLLLPQMVERGEGRVVNVSSVAATLSSPREAAYDASKAALSVFSEAAAVDLWDSGVKFMIVYPGVVDTDLFRVPDNDPLIAAVEPITVGEVVEAVLAGLATDALQLYVPAWFADLAATKAADVGTFLEGTAEFMRTAGTA